MKVVGEASNGEAAEGMSKLTGAEGSGRFEKSNEADEEEEEEEEDNMSTEGEVTDAGMVRLEKSNAVAEGPDDDDSKAGASAEAGAITTSSEAPEAPQKASVRARRRASDGTNEGRLKNRTWTTTINRECRSAIDAQQADGDACSEDGGR